MRRTYRRYLCIQNISCPAGQNPQYSRLRLRPRLRPLERPSRRPLRGLRTTRSVDVGAALLTCWRDGAHALWFVCGSTPVSAAGASFEEIGPTPSSTGGSESSPVFSQSLRGTRQGRLCAQRPGRRRMHGSSRAPPAPLESGGRQSGLDGISEGLRPAGDGIQGDMARLLSVNVGLPRDVAWRGKTVHTGIWKSPVQGRCRVGRLNLEGDGQGDLAGHGGEHRAVFVYQIDSYRYWEEKLGRTDFVPGQFGENLTVRGLPDDSVYIGDRYRIGSALFEVTQPRVTCYRVGIRMDEPRMAGVSDIQRTTRFLLPCPRGRRGYRWRRDREGRGGRSADVGRPRSTRCSIRLSILATDWNALRRLRRSHQAGDRRSSRC